ncbi:MAG: hypothetical protein LC808_35965, partial [Actinobacteria bacterium]|nr:hypothetical protein [Actinomycetota bacterium]
VSAFAEADSILFAAAVRAVLVTPPGRIAVRRDTGAADADNHDFAGVAELGVDQVGFVRAHTPDGSPHRQEIDQLVTSTYDQDTDVTDALLAAVLRWASVSGATAVTWWVTDWPERRKAYECQGFGLVGKWRLTGTGDQRVEEWQIRATLRPDPRFWQDELLGVLGDVAPRRPGWWYVLRSAAALMMFGLGAFLAVGLGVPLLGVLHFDQWPHLGPFLASVVMAAMLTAFTWPFMRAAWRSMGRAYAKSAATRLRKDPRPPVLYLRSFHDDPSTRKATRLGSLITEEQAVAAVVDDIGPFIGLGRADRVIGAARAEVADADWRPAVAWLLANAGLVVLRCGTGESLFWELEQAVKILRPEQLLMLVPTDEDTYRQFGAKAAGILPHPLPQLPIRGHAPQRLAAAIHFSSGWRPEAIPLRQPLPLRLMLALDTGLALRLGPILRQFTVRRFRFWSRRLGTTLFMANAVFFILFATNTTESMYQINEDVAKINERMQQINEDIAKIGEKLKFPPLPVPE